MSSDHFGNPSQGLRQPGQSAALPNNPALGDSPANPAAASSGYASGDSSGTKSPLHLGLGFLKGLGSNDKKTKDGQAPKRRGPKPDSKPALTRRQELNRQAQRTHRERKEVYVKNLEEHIMQLRETYTGVMQEKTAVEHENQKLRELLSLHGIPFDASIIGSAGYQSNLARSSVSQPSSGYPFQGSSSFSPRSQQLSSQEASPDPYGPNDPSMGSLQPQQNPQQALDYDQLGVDFVLASVSNQGQDPRTFPPNFQSQYDPRSHLEASCMDHLQYMCVRANQDKSDEGPVNGHALMWSCPPISHVDNLPDVQYPSKLPDMPNAELMKLLTLSQDLPLDGELTPVIALNIIRNHPRFHEMNLEDFEKVKNDLRDKTRCYGFGAVLEEFELRDALSLVFATKPDFSTFR